MKHILQKLYYGEINPSAEQTAYTPEQLLQKQQLAQAELELLRELPQALAPSLQQILEGHTALSACHAEQAFCEGFLLGAKIAMLMTKE